MRLSHERLDGELDILRDGRQEAAFVASDGVSRHAEPFCQFALGETEEEPLTSKPPTGQAAGRLREGA